MISLIRGCLLALLVGLCCHSLSVRALPSLAKLPRATAAAPLAAEQIHISLGQSQSDLWVNYVTLTKPRVSYILYGQSPSMMSNAVNASVSQFVDGGKLAKVRYMQEAGLLGLALGVRYFYQVVVDDTVPVSSLPVYNFTTISASKGITEPLRISMFGDYGVLNDQSHDRLEFEALNDHFDLIVHAGDFAYNLDDDNGDRGDLFMNMQQSFLTHVPYQVCAGNHESNYAFAHYKARFHMPGDESKSHTNLYSSFNVGPVHFISIDTELYFYDNYYNASDIVTQYEWLENDLIEANKQRDVRPWIVVYGHRPMYCTDDTNDGPSICTTDTAALRDGVGFNGNKRVGALEPLLFNYQVDFYFSGHMHSYERLHPVYRGQVIGTGYDPLIAPFQVIAGAAGCQEYLDNYDDDVYPWSAARSDSYGYGKFTVYNATHAHWAQVLDEDGSVLDQAWLVKFGAHSQHSPTSTTKQSLRGASKK